MALQGISIHVLQQKQGVRQSANPHVKPHKDLLGYFRSRLVPLVQGKPVEVTITIEPGFKRFSEDGLEIVVASGYATQCFWLDYTQCTVTGSHNFSSFTMWQSPADDATRQQLPLPAPRALGTPTAKTPADGTAPDRFHAREGYVSIWIRRGHLNDSRDELQDYFWLPTDPPKATKHLASTRARIIRDQWFRPLPSEHGHTHVLEFRNIGKSQKAEGVLQPQCRPPDDQIQGLKRNEPASDPDTKSKRVCLPTPQSSQPSVVNIKHETLCITTVQHNQDERVVENSAVKDRTREAGSKTSPHSLGPTPLLAAPKDDIAHKLETQSTNASERMLARLPAFTSDQQAGNVCSELGSDVSTENNADLQLVRPFNIGEPIPLVETQTWKAYYLTQLIE